MSTLAPGPKHASHDEKMEFYASMGVAVSSWLEVETALAALHTVILQPAVSGAAAAEFLRVVNLNIKITMIDGAASKVLPPDMLKEWNRLERRVGDHATRRNDIVHGHVVDNGVGTGPKIFLLSPSASLEDLVNVTNTLFKVKTKTKKGIQIYSTEELQRSGHLFRVLANDLSDFGKKIGKKFNYNHPWPMPWLYK